MSAENTESCLQRDSAERKGHVRAHRSFNRIWKERDSAEPDILGKILEKDNLNRAYKRVKANKGAPGIFKYLGFCLGKNGRGIYIRVHTKSWKKAKDKLRMLTSRSRCGSIVKTMKRIKVYMRGWLNYYSIADMKNNIASLNGWLYRRIRMCIWKQWKLPRTRRRKLLGLGLPEWAASEGAYSRKAYWRMANSGVVKRALTKERLIHWGFYDIATAYQSMHVNY